MLSLLEDAIGALEEGFALYDPNMRFMLCNNRYYDLVFVGPHQKFEPGQGAVDIAKQVFDTGAFMLPDNIEPDEMAEQTVQFIKSFGRDLVLERMDEKIIQCSSSRTNLGGYLITIIDITDRRKLEDGARKMLNDVVESLDQAIALYDSEMNFLFSNKLYLEEYFNRSNVQMPSLGENLADHIRRLADAKHFKSTEGLTTEDIVNFTIHNTANYLKNEELELTDGRVVSGSSHATELGGYLITLSDLTIKRQTERRVREMFNDVLETLHEGVVLLDDDGRLVLFNDKFLQMFDIPPDPSLYGMQIKDILKFLIETDSIYLSSNLRSDKYIQSNTDHIRDAAQGIEFPIKDGMLLGTSSVTPLGGRLITIEDVTDKLRSEERSLSAVNDAIQALDLGLVLWDANLDLVMANEQWFRIFFLEGERPQTGESITSVMEKLLVADFFSVPDGMSGHEYNAMLTELVKNYSKKVIFETNDGRVIDASSNATGLGGYLISFSDITEQQKVQKELERQREISHQNEKLSALGELLAGVAHELNNPLSIIVGYAQLLEGNVDDPRLVRRIERIEQAAERSAKIVKTFLAMARQRPTKLEVCSLNEIVLSALDISGYGLKTNGTDIKVELEEDLPLVFCDEDQLTQVLTNLIVNAEHALADKGMNGQLILRSSFDKEANCSTIEVRDNGEGIPKDIQSRIFEPFFTTKDVGVGTGIGLAFSHRIVDSHGGQLTLESEPGNGCSFFVHLNIASTEEIENTTSEVAEFPDVICRVLVIDDEEDVVDLIQEILEERGMIVETATNVQEALGLLKRQKFDVVLSDYKMPELNGQDFLKLIEVEIPHYAMRIGFITGDSMSSEVSEFFESTKSLHIEKPVTANDLLSLIRELYERTQEEKS